MKKFFFTVCIVSTVVSSFAGYKNWVPKIVKTQESSIVYVPKNININGTNVVVHDTIHVPTYVEVEVHDIVEL